ncbi:unnamed protein product [Bursaphelenchus xylophilus]|uniref:(pine wood nematode) hypothetical protein n=1 Tax=Bursaphelenchus xylophilus TaxID=6326 RepID=A0A1I7RJY7_BURXY|nr:unnamed protein product [Bursaphelenchus xylophilus]CAG9131631.1 unnamed protein product [Bursaphelenchus xylophilus]
MPHKKTLRQFSYRLDEGPEEDNGEWKRACLLSLTFIMLLLGTVAATVLIVIFGLKSFSEYKPEESS